MAEGTGEELARKIALFRWAGRLRICDVRLRHALGLAEPNRFFEFFCLTFNAKAP